MFKDNKFIKIIAIVGIILVAIILIFGRTKDYIEEISYEEYKEKITNKESFIIYFKKDDCQYCDKFSPKINKVAEENEITNIYSINLSDLSSNDTKELNKDVTVSSTPTVVFIEEGIELGTYARIEGNQTYKKIEEKLKLRGYIK